MSTLWLNVECLSSSSECHLADDGSDVIPGEGGKRGMGGGGIEGARQTDKVALLISGLSLLR